MVSVYIDPRSNIVYASYYIYGLYSVYGRKNVKFSMKYFKDHFQDSKTNDFDQYFSFVLVESNKIVKKIVIDFRDKNNINLRALDWCDTYGKVNFNSKSISGINEKIVAIGPNFGIRIWSDIETLMLLFVNFIKSGSYLPVSFRVFLSGYRWQMIRPKLEDYTRESQVSNSVFFISSLYKKEDHGPSTNLFRASFIRVCKASIANFSGGLFSKKDNPNYDTYADVVTTTYYSSDEYLHHTKMSLCVFNTPAVHGCHGWKLGEFMAMGKAIISMPFLNEMPVELKSGENIHFVSDIDELEFAVHKIIGNPDYRVGLERNVKKYYEQFLAPSRVIKKVIQID